MRNIIYKYNVGDYVKFKDKFHSTASCDLKKLAGTTAIITGRALPYNNKPFYHLNDNDHTAYPETCFAGLATESEFLAQSSLADEVDTLQGPETKCDTGDSGESESKWYRISFSAKLTADDLRAMKKCFFDAMNESMEIYDLEGLVIEEA